MAWLQEGVGVREVGRRLQVTHSVIQRLRDRFNNTGSVLEPRRLGRTRMTTRRDDRYVILSALRDRTATANTLRGQLRTATNILVSDQTVPNRLHEVNMRSRRRVVRPPLTRALHAARLAWPGGVIWPGQGSSGPGCSSPTSPATRYASTTAEFASGDVLESASSMLPFWSTTDMVAAPRWCGVASVFTTRHPYTVSKATSLASRTWMTFCVP